MRLLRSTLRQFVILKPTPSQAPGGDISLAFAPAGAFWGHIQPASQANVSTDFGVALLPAFTVYANPVPELAEGDRISHNDVLYDVNTIARWRGVWEISVTKATL